MLEKPVEKPIDRNHIVQVYSGKARRCMCGCSGKYADSSRFLEALKMDGDRGHDVNDRQVTRVVNIINNNLKDAETTKEGDYYSVEVGDRLYVAYTPEILFEEEAKALAKKLLTSDPS